MAPKILNAHDLHDALAPFGRFEIDYAFRENVKRGVRTIGLTLLDTPKTDAAVETLTALLPRMERPEAKYEFAVTFKDGQAEVKQ